MFAPATPRLSAQHWPVQICLPRGSLARGAGALRLKVQTGRLWITRSGELDDLFVLPGQSVELAAGDDSLIEADRSSVVEVSARPRA